MKQLKTTYLLLIVIGFLSLVASVYLYYKGKPFNDYFIPGMLGIVFAGTGYSSLLKMKKNAKKE